MNEWSNDARVLECLGDRGHAGGQFPQAAEFTPAVIFDMGGKFDKSFNEAAYNGAEKFKDETGMPISSSRSPTRASATRPCAGWRSGPTS